MSRNKDQQAKNISLINSFFLLTERFKTRTVDSAFSRFYTFFVRYGFDSQQFTRTLFEFIRLVKKYDVTPTLPVTASVVKRHPSLFQKVQAMGVELAVHGYKHVDYTLLKSDIVRIHFKNAAKIFQQYNINYFGYRFPYLRQSEEKIDLLEAAGFKWDSSKVISWDSLNPEIVGKKGWAAYQKILKTYQAADAGKYATLPCIRKNIVEIPVSVPDDDILIERLGLRDTKSIAKIWRRMLSSVHENGELLVLQVHPERFWWYKNALEKILRLSKSWGDVWIAPIGEIANWWMEREKFNFNIERISNTRYKITANCTDRATVLQKDKIIKRRVWEIESPRKPVIGLSPATAAEVVNFLKTEGFVYQITSNPHECNIFLGHKANSDKGWKERILKFIEKNKFPLIRFWRWPAGAKCSLAISGDIDYVDVWDYWERFRE